MAIAALTRERIWRVAALQALIPLPGETIVDLGAGTGSQALLIKAACPTARVVAVDPDPVVRGIATRKAAKAGCHIVFETAFGNDMLASVSGGGADAVVCSLVLHQCPDAIKRGMLTNARRLLRPRGRLIIADYGAPSDLFMALAFLLVRSLDGFETTCTNARGAIPQLIDAAGFAEREEHACIRTPTGAIYVWRALAPHA